MILESLYDPNTTVYILREHGIREGRVAEVEIKRNNKGVQENYYKLFIASSSSNVRIKEEKIFATKVEAAYEWLKNQDLEPRDVIQGFLNRA